jgi:hypothetical protein
LFVSSPSALTELSIAISEAVKSGAFELVLFDSLSTLNIYDLGNSTERFTSHVINRIKSEDKKGIFTCLEDDVNTSIVKNSFMYIDKSLKFDDFYQSLQKKKIGKVYGVLFLVAIVGAFSFFNLGLGSSPTATGMVISEATASTPGFIIPLAALVALVSFLIYRGFSVKPVDESKLKAIKPANTNPKEVQKNFKNKIKNWLKA